MALTAANTSNTRWAAVTGASSGIGAGICACLAARGWNVVLIGRDESTLKELAAKLEQSHVKTHTISADLSTPEGVSRVITSLEQNGIVVSALVNNAGFGIHSPFEKSSSVDEARMIDLQLKTLVQLTHAVLPGMLKNKEGYILNVSSVYAFSPVPQQAVYAACKTFMLSFSRTLSIELHDTGVSVSVLCPGITMTQFRSRAGMKEKKSSFAMTSEQVAEIGVKGMLRRKLVIVPGWHNNLYVTFASLLPASILGRFTRWFNKRRGIAKGEGAK